MAGDNVFPIPGMNLNINSGFSPDLAVDVGGKIEYTQTGKPFGIFKSDAVPTAKDLQLEKLRIANQQKIASMEQKRRDKVYGPTVDLPAASAPVSDTVFFAGKYWQKKDLYIMAGVGGLVALGLILAMKKR